MGDPNMHITNPIWRTAITLKNLSNGLTDHCKILHSTADPSTFRPTSIMAKRWPTSATAELLLKVARTESVYCHAAVVIAVADNSTNKTRHRASTSMYSLTFCVRVMLPERHQWKPAVQAAAVMLRTPPVDGQSPASSARRSH